MYEKVRFCRIYLLAFFALAIALCLPVHALAAGEPAEMVHAAAEIVSADTLLNPAFTEQLMIYLPEEMVSSSSNVHIIAPDTAGIPAYSFSGGWDMMPIIFFALGMTAGTVFGFALSALQQMAVRRKQ